MTTTEEGRRRRKNRSRKKKTETVATTTTVLDLPDHLLEHILLRLGPSACLVRTAAVCRRWCRVVADAGFLARLRSAHRRHAMLAGSYHNVKSEDGRPVTPVFVPVPSSPEAPLAVDVRSFVLDFLPDVAQDSSWEIADSRGSLLLLGKWTEGYCQDVVVCEPLTRRRQGILLPPDFGFWLGMFLVDGDDSGRHLSMSNFRIIGAIDKTLACVFTPGSDGGWRLVSSEATSEANLAWWSDDDPFIGRANGSIYWGIEDGDGTQVIVLNETTVEYSIVQFPWEIWGPYAPENGDSWVIGGEDGILRIVRLLDNDLKVFAQRHLCSSEDDGGDDNEWVLEKELVGLAEATIGLPEREESFFEQGVRIVVANAEYILLAPIETPPEKTWLFSVELDTMRVERDHERNKYEGAAYPCELPWPPVFPSQYGMRAKR